jgi:hypothetical protein
MICSHGLGGPTFNFDCGPGRKTRAVEGVTNRRNEPLFRSSRLLPACLAGGRRAGLEAESRATSAAADEVLGLVTFVRVSGHRPVSRSVISLPTVMPS